MKPDNNLAGCKRTVLIALARLSLRIADRLLRTTFKGFRAGYLPLGILRAASRMAHRLRRWSLNLWARSRGRPHGGSHDMPHDIPDGGPRRPIETSGGRKPLPECLTRLLRPPAVRGGPRHARKVPRAPKSACAGSGRRRNATGPARLPDRNPRICERTEPCVF